MMPKRSVLLRAALAAVVITVLLSSHVFAGNREIGGYVAQAEDRFVRNVWNFIKNFQSSQNIGSHSWKYDQYYYMEPFVFEGSHGSYVDSQDLAYVACHGTDWKLCSHWGTVDVDLRDAPGYGDLPQGHDMEFFIVESCSTFISAADPGFDWQGYRYNGPGGMMRGLHQGMGFRTDSYSDNEIPAYFALRTRCNQIVWCAWFDAIQDERAAPARGPWEPEAGVAYPGWASAIMPKQCKWDRLGSYVADPVAADLMYNEANSS